MLFRQYWLDKGHEFGLCLTNQRVKYVNIPKCASSWTKQVLLRSNMFRWANYYDDPEAKVNHSLIVLRDPVDRWLSGVCEYFAVHLPNINTTQFNSAFYDLLIDQTTVDDHTEKQVYFIDGIDFSNCTFFKCDNTYSELLHSRFKDANWFMLDPVHVTSADPLRSKFKKIFQPLLENSKYINHIKHHYKEDYDLIQSIQFYGTR